MGALRFQYSADFEAKIVHLHRGKEAWPHYRSYLTHHLGGPDGRVALFINHLCPELIFRCGPLQGKKVLDFGCGTGASAVALALSGAKVVAVDIDQESLEIARQRILEHSLEDRVRIMPIQELSSQEKMSSFDLVLMNGVIEHIPITEKGLRAQVLKQASEALKPGGHLYINETPNRLWPKDTHSTGLWFLPWTPAGSKIGYGYAVSMKKHTECATVSPGPRGLEEVGAWGATYWEVNRALKKLGFTNQNTSHRLRRKTRFTHAGSFKRRFLESVLYLSLTFPFGIPLIAFFPFLDHLVFVKSTRLNPL
jgi:2-polyprenyl-3-methyl-5-hydroxy-6-metoxy-1,4-benzoquinol methylase